MVRMVLLGFVVAAVLMIGAMLLLAPCPDYECEPARNMR